jgi:hypothetical protein
MGIPSYFSYIIKNYNIIRKLDKCEKFDSLFMDCNSIIYDCYYELEKIYKEKPFDISTIEDKLIKNVISKIEYYIDYISPSKNVYITFDGVAPLAKMDQQRSRRHKSAFISQISGHVKIWNTSSITPGTKFMEMLSEEVYAHFSLPIGSTPQIMVSCSDQSGEGEHKIFRYIRNNDCSNDKIAIYGLDSDLIMLSLYHVEFTKNIYVFREAVNFKNFVSEGLEEKELKRMEIKRLKKEILKEMRTSEIVEYVLISSMLGNDYVRGIVSLNLRRDGMKEIIRTYKKVNKRLVEKGEIVWKNLKKVIEELSKNEKERIKEEIEYREKIKYKKEEIENIPLLYRGVEKYILEEDEGWEKRYYKSLFGIVKDEEIVEICENYMNSIEWVFKYYTKGEESVWRNKWDYAPLLKDINRTEHKYKKEENISMELVQLIYVLPKESKELLKEKEKKIIEKYEKYYVTENEYKWSFCRYFWEAHPILPEISIEILKDFEKKLLE